MSEKRFILAEDSNGLFSIFDNEDPEDDPLIYGARFGTEKIVDLLNEFNDENNELKAEIEQSDSISEDIVCADIQHQLLKVTDETKELKKENEQLRKELDSFHPVMFQDMRYGTVTLYSKGGIDE